MGKGGGGGTQTVVNTQEIPKFIQDQLKQTFNTVENFRPNPNTVAGVAGFTPDQLAYQQSLKNFAQNTPMGTAIAQQTFQDIAQNSQIGTGNLQNLLGQNVSTSALQNVMGQDVQFDNPLAGGSGINTDILQGLTQARTTPFLQQQLDSAIQGAVDQATSQYALGGRLGSDSFADALGGGVASAAAPILNQAAQQDAANQLQAAQALANAQQASGALSLQGATAAADVQQQNLQNQLQTAQALADAQQTETAQALQAASQLPQFQQLQLQQLGVLGDVGAQQQQLKQAQLNQQADVVAAQNQANQARINNILAAIGNRGQTLPGGTSTKTGPGRSPLAGGLGGALSGAALGSQIGAVGGPLGALVGGGLGLLGLI